MDPLCVRQGKQPRTESLIVNIPSTNPPLQSLSSLLLKVVKQNAWQVSW